MRQALFQAATPVEEEAPPVVEEPCVQVDSGRDVRMTITLNLPQF